MRVFFALLIGLFTLDAGAESAGNPADTASDRAAAATASPWQGTWTGSETNSFGTKHPLRVKIRVTNGKLSGSWHVQSAGSKPITGQINGGEAAISILQGGSMVKATLVDENSFTYRGIRGYGTLTRQQKTEVPGGSPEESERVDRYRMPRKNCSRPAM